MEIRVAPDATAAADIAAATIARRLVRAVRERGTASVAFSGGSTPARMLAALSAPGVIRPPVPWSSVDVFQVDERVAPDGHPARNLALLEPLRAAGARVHPMPVTATDLRRAVRRHAASLPVRFDVVHLGVGDDGHTASWPPGDPVIESPDPVAISAPYAGYVRTTLTPPVVNGARSRVLLVAGAAKREPLARWLAGDRSLPVSAVRRTSTLLVVDAAAAPG